jgi:hypothetical protein
MALHDELMDHAHQLASSDPSRPRRVNLRRAVSAAYYSVFHLLVASATRRFEGELRPEVARWYGHDRMKQVCGWFGSSGTPPPSVAAVLGYPKPGRVSPQLSELADTFVALQEARHRADYDLAYRQGKQEVGTLLDHAQRAHDVVPQLAGDPIFELFLTLLLTGDKVVVSR